MSVIRRREFVALLGGAAMAWPLAARAQQAAVPVIGFLDAASAAGRTEFMAGFRQGLAEAGYVEGHNVGIEYRWAEGDYDRLPALATDLVRRRVNVIVTPGTTAAALAESGSVAVVAAFHATERSAPIKPIVRRAAAYCGIGRPR